MGEMWVSEEAVRRPLRTAVDLIVQMRTSGRSRVATGIAKVKPNGDVWAGLL